jgi:hypothetical protein
LLRHYQQHQIIAYQTISLHLPLHLSVLASRPPHLNARIMAKTLVYREKYCQQKTALSKKEKRSFKTNK